MSKNKTKAQIEMRDFHGCINCPFSNQQTLGPCDFMTYEVQVTFVGAQYIGDAKVFGKGEVVKGDAVIFQNMIFCITCFSHHLGVAHKIDLLGIKVKIGKRNSSLLGCSSMVKRIRSPWDNF